MTQLAVSGASGKTGWRVVEEALKRGRSVRAIVRPASVLPSALAQAEQEDVEGETLFTDIPFRLEDGGELMIVAVLALRRETRALGLDWRLMASRPHGRTLPAWLTTKIAEA